MHHVISYRMMIYLTIIYDLYFIQGSICETRKGPKRPRFDWVLTISYMSMFWKIKPLGMFGQLPVARGS